MTKFMFRALLAAVSASVLISACATPGSEGNPWSAIVDAKLDNESAATLSNEERLLRTERNRVFQGVAMGCVTGVGLENLGRVGDLIRGDQPEDINWRETAFACVAGGAAGAAAGAYVNARNRPVAEALNREDQLIAGAREEVEYYRELNAAAEQLIEKQREKIQRLNAQYNAGAITANQYRAEIVSAETNLALLNEKIVEANGNIRTIEEDLNNNFFPEAGRARMREQLRDLRAERDRLQQKLAALIEVYDAVPPDFRPSAQV